MFKYLGLTRKAAPEVPSCRFKPQPCSLSSVCPKVDWGEKPWWSFGRAVLLWQGVGSSAQHAGVESHHLLT